MNATVLLFILLTGSVFGALGAVWWVGRPPMTAHRVIVNLATTDTVALRGVWWRQRGHWIVLRDVAGLRREGPAVPMDGDVVVHRSNIAFVQVLTNDGGEQLRTSG